MLKLQGSRLQRIGVCLVLFGVFSSAIAQGRMERRWKVRKTGEFGRRIDSSEIVSQELQLPTKQFRLNEPNLDTAETRGYGFIGAAVRKPSQNLELPNISPYSQDQLAQATGDGEGYSYSPLDNDEDASLDGYDYTPPSPVGKPSEEEPEAAAPSSSSLPDPSEPGVVPGGNPFSLETDAQIDADGLETRREPLSPSSQSPSSRPGSCNDDNDPNCWEHGYEGIIPGIAGEDYPTLSEIVATDFNCDDQEYSGYYADTDERARCQIFHICLKRNKYRKTRQWSFLCPNGTLFSQSDFVCVWWGNTECDGATTRSLYSLNEQLGWDNITEGPSTRSKIKVGSNKNGELQSDMSALSQATSFSKGPMVPTTYRPAFPFGKTSQPSTKTAQPYRVPVKVSSESGRPRTKLQEVTQSALHGKVHELDYGDDTEHDFDESSNFETSLRQQSESRHRTKSASSLRKSHSEGYELKSSPDGVQPFVVNRPNQENSQNEAEPQQFNYDNSENEGIPQVVMMPSVQRFPDGSEGYAEVPVMMSPYGTTDRPEEGYRYPNPTEGTSTPAPTYLPPYRETQATTEPTTTTTEYFPPPTIPTEPPIDHEEYQSDYQTTTTLKSDGYRYSNPTTTELPGYRYKTPESSQNLEAEEGYNYPQPETSTTEQPNDDYTYTQPKTTEEPENGYRYSQPPMEQLEEGYQYPNPTSLEGEKEDGYQYNRPESGEQLEAEQGNRYSQATTTKQPQAEEGYRYNQPTTIQQPQTEEGYRYGQPTTTKQPQTEEGYKYETPSTTSRSQNLRKTNPTTTTEQPSTTEEALEGYKYQSPEKQQQSEEGYNYPTPTTTVQSAATRETNEQYQVTDNEVTDSYQFESTRVTNVPKAEYGLPEENSQSTPTTNPNPPKNQDVGENFSTTPVAVPADDTNELPPGGYLPPKDDSSLSATGPASTKQEGEQVDEDTLGIEASPDSENDYDEEENVIETNPSGPAESDKSGYSYNLPTPPSSSNPIVLNGGALGTETQLQIPNLREQFRSRNRQRLTNNNNNNGNTLDSDEKLNEILKQIQSGGIEAVDSSGKPIEFSKLKQLLLSAPRGSVELKGEVDSLTSSSTEIPASPQRPQNEKQPFYHTVTTAQMVHDNDNVVFNNNPNQSPSTASGLPSPSGFYLPPEFNTNSNNNNIQQPQSNQEYESNNIRVQLHQPSFDIKLPNREFESHFVENNIIDTNNNQNNFNLPPQNANVNTQYQQEPVQYQQSSGFIANQQQTQPQSQQQAQVQSQPYFQNQNFPSNPTISTSLAIPSGENYNSPALSEPQQDFDRLPLQNNAELPSFQQNQNSFQFQQQPSPVPSVTEQVKGEYLPPRAASSSILQSQYYKVDASAQQSSRPFFSQPIQLTENIQLQQSFGQPLPSSSAQHEAGNSNGSPLLDPRNIKIVPALFVHEHTSVAAQAENNLRSESNRENAFETFETSSYSGSHSRANFGARGSLAVQLNQIANSVYAPPNSNVGRQFFRRSNSRESSSQSSSSVSPSEPSHTIEKATKVISFTLEDARTSEELQKYHHEDLKRFHSENIAKQGSILDDVLSPRTTQSSSTPFEHRSAPIIQSEQDRSNFNDEKNRENANSESRRENNNDGSHGGSSSSTTSNSGSGSTRFSINSSDLRSNRGRSNNEEYFIPVSGSYGGNTKSSTSSNSNGNRGRVSSSSDDSSFSDGSQFRLSGRGGSRSFEQERTLLRRFIPEEEGGFGSRLLY